MHPGWAAAHVAMLAWVVFAVAWIGHELLEQRAIRASVERVALREGKPEDLVPYDFEAALYLVQELNQDESWDEGVRLARATEKLLKGRIRPSTRRKGSLVRVTFFQRRALEAALASWPEETAQKVRRCLHGKKPPGRVRTVVTTVLCIALAVGLVVTRQILGFFLRSFLFGVEPDLQSDLENGSLSDDFLRAFRTQGISLSANITITPEKEGGRWQIVDADTAQAYTAERTDKALRIYGPPAVAVRIIRAALIPMAIVFICLSLLCLLPLTGLARATVGEQPGDIPLEAEEREALEDLARSWSAEPARRASSAILRALLEGAPLEEVKPSASEIEVFWTVIGNWRLEKSARLTAAEKLAKVIGRPRKGALELGPAAGRPLARLAAEWKSRSYSKRRAERLNEILSGKPLEEVKLPADDEARLRAAANSWKRSSATDEREAAGAILEAFGGPRFGEVVFDDGEIEFLNKLAREKLASHRERRHRLLSALAPVLENVTYLDQHHMFDIVNLLADDDEESRLLSYRAVEALGEFVEKALRERPGPSSGRLRRRFLHLLTSAAEKRTPNPYLIIETSDATKRERADLLSALNLHKRKLVTGLLGRFAAEAELRSLSRLLSDPDIGDDMEEVFRARGLLSPGEPVGQDEAERKRREDPG